MTVLNTVSVITLLNLYLAQSKEYIGYFEPYAWIGFLRELVAIRGQYSLKN